METIGSSEVAEFKSCRRRWLWQYRSDVEVDAPWDGVAPSLAGLAVRALYEREVDGRDPHEAFASFRQEVTDVWARRGFDPVLVQEAARACVVTLDRYLRWVEETGADADLECTASEALREVPLYDGRVRVDALLPAVLTRSRDGRRLLHVVRLTSDPAGDARRASVSEETRWLVACSGDLADGVLYSFVAHPSEDPHAAACTRVEITVPTHHRTRYDRSLRGAVRDLLSARDELDGGVHPDVVAYPTGGAHCASCPFTTRCYAHDTTED